MRRLLCVAAAVVVGMMAGRTWGMTVEERREYRGKLMGILPVVESFEAWVKATDELPPDFDALPRVNGLPEPLRFLDGRAVKEAGEWKVRRAEIRELFEKYVWGSIPPLPKVARAEVTGETAGEGFTTRNVTLHVGPEGKGTMRVTLVIPAGKGPFPVVMGPGLTGGMAGSQAPTLLRRGYITASYAGNDGNDDSAGMLALYPGFDCAVLPRRAWAATAVVDFLQGVPEVDKGKVAIFGYSRDGKQIAIAAALDERISAVVAGSTGVGGVLPFRLAGERNQAESIESTTKMFPEWFHPRLRFFVGREDRLPVDGNLLLALLAPRPCLMVAGFNDEVANAWGDEQSLLSAEKAYAFLGAPHKLGIHRLPGFHGANDMEVALDFLDSQFGRTTRTWTNNFVFPWDYQAWNRRTRPIPDGAKLGGYRDQTTGVNSLVEWEPRAASIRKTLQWTLGDAPPRMPIAARGRGGPPGTARGPATFPGRGDAAVGGRRGGGGGSRGPGASGSANPGQTAPDVPAWVIQRSLGGLPEFGWAHPEAQQTLSRPVSFGQGARGTLYYPANTPEGAKLPTVVWLHSYSYPLGYMWVYHRDPHPILALIKQGYAVLAYDQAGFGSRMNEAGPFMDRFPRWSLMGRMVEDARAAIDTLSRDAQVDPDQLWLFGYAMGGTVALHTAALEPRVKGVVSIAGFTPMHTPDQGQGNRTRYYVDRPLMPMLGAFADHTQGQVPYDYDELLATLAPRPVLVVQPQLDRDAVPAEVRTAVEKARHIYSLHHAADTLALDEPWDYNRLPANTQDRAIAWMKKQIGK